MTPSLEGLPELPKRAFAEYPDAGANERVDCFTADQMRSYARLAVQQERAKERERCAKLAESSQAGDSRAQARYVTAKSIAAAIRSIKDDSQEEERKT